MCYHNELLVSDITNFLSNASFICKNHAQALKEERKEMSPTLIITASSIRVNERMFLKSMKEILKDK
jgi:hypothetical protein